jgi:MFS family permease
MPSPFSVRSFRFQWPADLATSWAFEMEAVILGWYVLSTTGSVNQLVILAAVGWLGSLFSPFLGLAGDRIGHRAVLVVTRSVYAALALALTVLTLTDSLRPWHVFAISAIAGLMRSSDLNMRSVIVGQTMKPGMLLWALGLSRTTSDSARMVGALAGAGGMALVGMGPAYIAVTILYVAALLLSLGMAGRPAGTKASSAHPMADLAEGFRYAWNKPELLGAFALVFLVNLLAFPIVFGLLPYVAKDVYGAGQIGLGYLAAAFWLGSLAGSLLVGAGRSAAGAARTMLWAGGLWFMANLFFGLTSTLWTGVAVLGFAGLMQGLCMTPLAAMMLRTSAESMRGRVMGVRSLAIWGLPLGLLAAGPLVEWLGFRTTSVLYAGFGLAATLAIGYYWREVLWYRSAAANTT